MSLIEITEYLNQLDKKYSEKLDQKIYKLYDKLVSENVPFNQIMEIKNYHKYIKKKNVKEHCAAKIVFWTLIDNEIYIFLGKNSKYKEWTPFGGTCNDKNQSNKSCPRLMAENTINDCLQKELFEESRGLLDKILFGCNFLPYVIPYRLKSYHTNIYFSYISNENQNIDKIINEFRNRNKDYAVFLQLNGVDPKPYFEMEDLDLIHINIFGRMMYNSMQYYHTQEFLNTFGDKKFTRDVENNLNTLLKTYAIHKVEETEEKLDMFFFIGLAKSLSHFFNKEYSSIEEIINDLSGYMMYHTTCEYHF